MSYFLGSVLVFLTLFVAIDAMTTVVHYNASALSFLKFYLYFLPSMIYQLIPVVSLVATVMTISALQKNNELVALYSLGMSLARICRPLLALVVLVSALGYVFSDTLLPYFNEKKNYTLHIEIQNKPQRFVTIKVDKIWYRSQNKLFYFSTISPDSLSGRGLLLFEFSPDWQLLQTITAEEVDFKNSQWTLKDGVMTVYLEPEYTPVSQNFEEKVIAVEQSVSDFQETGKASEVLTQEQLLRFIKRNKTAGLDTVRYEVDYHAKYSYAFSALVMALLGIPFAVGRARSGGSLLVNISICLGLTVAYQALYNASLTLGRYDQLSPFWAAWGPNALVFLVAWVLLVRLRQ